MPLLLFSPNNEQLLPTKGLPGAAENLGCTEHFSSRVAYRPCFSALQRYMPLSPKPSTCLAACATLSLSLSLPPSASLNTMHYLSTLKCSAPLLPRRCRPCRRRGRLASCRLPSPRPVLRSLRLRPGTRPLGRRCSRRLRFRGGRRCCRSLAGRAVRRHPSARCIPSPTYGVCFGGGRGAATRSPYTNRIKASPTLVLTGQIARWTMYVWHIRCRCAMACARHPTFYGGKSASTSVVATYDGPLRWTESERTLAASVPLAQA